MGADALFKTEEHFAKMTPLGVLDGNSFTARVATASIENDVKAAMARSGRTIYKKTFASPSSRASTDEVSRPYFAAGPDGSGNRRGSFEPFVSVLSELRESSSKNSLTSQRRVISNYICV